VRALLRASSEGRRTSISRAWDRAAPRTDARLLADAGLRAGRPYRKRRDAWIVPLYGHRAVDQVLAWVDEAARTG